MNIIGSNFTHISLAVAIPALTIIFLIISYVLFRKKKSKQVATNLDDLYLKIKEDIKFSITPKFIEISPNVSNLIELAIEVWRIEQRVNRSLPLLPDNQQSGLTNSIQKLKRYLDRCDIEIHDYTGQKFNDGLNLDVLSVEKGDLQTEYRVKETIEPTVMHKGQVIHKAKITILSN